MNWPQTPQAWQEAIAAGLGLTAVQGQQAYTDGRFPYDPLNDWLAETYSVDAGYSPDFVPALQRNLRGLVAWVYGDGTEPHWPGSDEALPSNS